MLDLKTALDAIGLFLFLKKGLFKMGFFFSNNRRSFTGKKKQNCTNNIASSLGKRTTTEEHSQLNKLKTPFAPSSSHSCCVVLFRLAIATSFP